jgi:putative tryptophan/tyrosine transport system substrate-binding protein
MQRRKFISLIGGVAATWPLTARAQQSDRMRRIGVLIVPSEGDPQSRARGRALEQGLGDLGWIVARNLQIDYRFGISDDELARAAAADLLRLGPDVVIANSPPAVRAVRAANSTIPVVFVAVSEPIALGLISNLARPGGNTTGFTNLEPSLGGKWLELLKELAPQLTRAAFLFSPTGAPVGPLFFRSGEEAARRIGVAVVSVQVHTPEEIEAAMAKLGRQPGSGLIVPPDTLTTRHHKLIVEQAAGNRLPALYAFRYFAVAGGLASYGPDVVDQFRRAGAYVNRILRGEKAGDLPVQQPTKFEFVINLKTAKALALTVPEGLLNAADEVIE